MDLPEQRQQQENISAGEGSSLRETGKVLNYPGQVREMSYWRTRDRFSVDWRNIAQNDTNMRVVVTMRFWTAVSP